MSRGPGDDRAGRSVEGRSSPAPDVSPGPEQERASGSAPASRPDSSKATASHRTAVRVRADQAGQRAEEARLRASVARRSAEALRARIGPVNAATEPSVPPAPSSRRRDDRVVDALTRLFAEGLELRASAARLSESIADEAEKFAAQLEHSALRGDRERRMSIAETERRIAGIERRNAVRLRGEDSANGAALESLPNLPGFGAGPGVKPDQ